MSTIEKIVLWLVGGVMIYLFYALGHAVHVF
jgi:hypothetical protein